MYGSRHVNGIPVSGFGVYALDARTTEKAVSDALEAGYLHIDTAQSYGNEAACGAAIAASGLSRDQFFVTTKVTPMNFGAGLMAPSVRASCDALGVDQIDLLLIHYPSPWDMVPFDIYIDQLGAVRDAGLTRKIGVSNFTIAQMNAAEKILGAGSLATNQVEIHVFNQNRKVADHCKVGGIPATAYCALARGGLFGEPAAKFGPHPTLQAMAGKHDATIAQIGLAFLRGEGHVTLCTATAPHLIKSNLAAETLHLDAADMAALRLLDRGKRLVDTVYFPIFD